MYIDGICYILLADDFELSPNKCLCQAIYVHARPNQPLPTSYPSLNDLLLTAEVKSVATGSPNFSKAANVVRSWSNPKPHDDAVPRGGREADSPYNTAVVVCYYLVYAGQKFDEWNAALWGEPHGQVSLKIFTSNNLS